jgi:hypothetical protein
MFLQDLWQGIAFSQSKAEARVDGSTGVKFADVAGIDEAVDELQEGFTATPSSIKLHDIISLNLGSSRETGI